MKDESPECPLQLSVLSKDMDTYSHKETDRLPAEDPEDRMPQTIHQFGSQRSAAE
jgi:hypothetical protein